MSIKKTIRQVADTIGIKGKLKKEQISAIKDGLDGHDLFVVAPTSFGKSAIFQILAVRKRELTIVIVPTLSLLHDQVDQLQQRDLRVAALASDCMPYHASDIQRALKQYGYLILYTTPESLWKLDLSDIPVSLLVVDECHCVTSWGYGFRAAYLEIGDFLEELPYRPQVVALTATAPVSDREQIKKLLRMEHIKEYEVSLYRPKLTFAVYSFVSEEKRQRELERLLKQFIKSDDGSCIIYCTTKKYTEAVYSFVKERHPNQAAICHSNLPSGKRKQNEKKFLHGDRRIMVATSAFGMGINKSDVRLVIHYNLPLSLIDYYQQAGRAGRDGGKARCILFYRKSDYDLNRWVIEKKQNPDALGRSLEALDEMKEYADAEKGCMVQRMLLALGEKLDKSCGRCTYCQKARRHK